MPQKRLIPIIYVVEHEVEGVPRWTGRAEKPGVMHMDVLVLRVGGRLMAVRNRCPHRKIPISNARLDEAAGTLQCPSHGWEFEITGSDLVGRPVVEKDGAFFMVVD